MLASGQAKAAAASALSVRELQAELRARGISTVGLLDKEDLVAALARAPLLPQAPAPAGAQSEAEMDAVAQQDMARLMEAVHMSAAQHGSGGGGGGPIKFEDLVGKAASERIAAAQERAAARGSSGSSSSGGSGGGGGGGRSAIFTGSGLVDAGAMDTSSPLSRAEFLELCQRTGRRSPTAGDAMAYGLLSMRLMASAEGDRALADFAVGVVKSAEGHPAMQEGLLGAVLDEAGTTRGLKSRGKVAEMMQKFGVHREREEKRKS